MGDSSFAEKLLLFLEKLECCAKSLVVLGCVVLLCSQLVLTQVPARKYLSYVDKLEGTRIQGEQVSFAEGAMEITEKSVTAIPGVKTGVETRMLILSFEELPGDKAVVIVNGHNRIHFINGEVTLSVQEGDALEIDGSGMKRLLNFHVRTPHDDIESPMSGLTVETKGNTASLGVVRFKH